VQREDSRYKEAADLFKGKPSATSKEPESRNKRR
jgi:hypothetical protein